MKNLKKKKQNLSDELQRPTKAKMKITQGQTGKQGITNRGNKDGKRNNYKDTPEDKLRPLYTKYMAR